jgi:hypothetical protein
MVATTPELKEQLAQILLSKFELSPALLKELVGKATSIVEKNTRYSLQARFQQSGFFGVAKDLFKNLSKNISIKSIDSPQIQASSKPVSSQATEMSRDEISSQIQTKIDKEKIDDTNSTKNNNLLLQQILKNVSDLNNKYSNKLPITGNKKEETNSNPIISKEKIKTKSDTLNQFQPTTKLTNKPTSQIFTKEVNVLKEKVQNLQPILQKISLSTDSKNSISTPSNKQNTKQTQIPINKQQVVVEVVLPKLQTSLLKNIPEKFNQETEIKQKRTSKSRTKKIQDLKDDIFSTEKTQQNIKSLKEPDLSSVSNDSTTNIQSIPNSYQNNKKTEKDFLQEEEKPKQILIAGITPEGVKSMQDNLPAIFQSIFKKLPKQTTEQQTETPSYGSGILGMLPKGLLALGGGLGLLLGGLAALVTGLQTEGPFKGLLKIFSKVGLTGGLKLLEKGAKTFLKSLTNVVKAPVSLLKNLTRSIGKIFGVGTFKAVTTAIKGAKGIFTKMLGGLVKFLTPFLKKLPLIGTVISFGFAYTRFKSGDTIGGIIDILSGVASIFPGVGTAIAIGLDVLNAFLDFKTGGATKETSKKKTNIFKDIWSKIKDWLSKQGENWPVIGPAIRSYRAFKSGNILEGLKQFAYIAPPFELLGALAGDTETSKPTQATAGWLKNIGKKIKDWFVKNAEGFPTIGPAIKAYKAFKEKDYLRGIKQLAYMIPAFEIFGAMAGDTDTTKTAQSAGNILKTVGNWVGNKLYKVFKSTMVIGPAIKAIEAFKAGEYLKGFKQLAYIIPPLEILGTILGDTETTGMAKTTVSVGKNVGAFLGKAATWIGNTLYRTVKMIPVIGPAIKAVEAFIAGNYADGFKQLAYIIPPFEFLGALLGDTEASGLTKTGATVVKSMAGLFGQIKNLILKGLLNLLPESILGISVRNRVASMLGVDLGPVSDETTTPTQENNTTAQSTGQSSPAVKKQTNDVYQPKNLSAEEVDKWRSSEKNNLQASQASKEATVALAEGGVVTKPIKAVIGEAGGEAVIPLEKFFNGKDFTLNNTALGEIVVNTKNTNDNIRTLGTAILKLAQTFNTKPNSQSNNNIFINGQQTQLPSASQIAASNVDPIKMIRQQFGIA